LLSVDGDVVETDSVTVEENSKTEITFSHGFDEAGAYSLSVEEVNAGEVTVLAPADIEIDGAELASDTVETEQEVDVSATVVNTGDVAGTFEAELSVDGDIVETTTVDIAGQSETEVVFSRLFDDAGIYDISINGISAGELTVLEPATFEVTDATLSSEDVNPGEAVEVSAKVLNTGDVSGTVDIILQVDGDTVERTPVEIAGGEESTVYFDKSFEEAGDYNLAINDVDAGTVTVKPEDDSDGSEDDSKSAVDVTGDGNPATDTTGDGLLNDVTGDGEFTRLDVETLAYNLDNTAVQENAELFDFAGIDDSEVTSHDVQALYEQWRNTDSATFEITETTLEKTEIEPGEGVGVSATVANTGDESGTFEVELSVDGETRETTRIELLGGEKTSVQFTEAFDEAGEYDLAVNGVSAGTLTVEDKEDDGTERSSVDVTGDGNPATDTTGDGLLNDVTGDGEFTRADVEALANNLDNPAVQDNAELFDFAGIDDSEVTSHDVQALFMQFRS